MCYCTAVLIGTLAWIIADMDFVYVGVIKVTPGPFYDLLSVMTTLPPSSSDDKDMTKPRLTYTASAENLLATAHDYNRSKPFVKARDYISTKLQSNKTSKVYSAELHPDDKQKHKGLMRLSTMDWRRKSLDSQREHVSMRSALTDTSAMREMTSVGEINHGLSDTSSNCEDTKTDDDCDRIVDV
jgi:hypothetical protein